ncbi:hypothetical protein CRG98_014973 [Punica granatum]|uniref:Uncharacterized protein n=1 Tax=Punica granatum TaxID=22663 RepID=A0A2I0K7V6_PUNGR|nr:hypothetical protein CRG98_014973 [Punica granatum]
MPLSLGRYTSPEQVLERTRKVSKLFRPRLEWTSWDCHRTKERVRSCKLQRVGSQWLETLDLQEKDKTTVQLLGETREGCSATKTSELSSSRAEYPLHDKLEEAQGELGDAG